MVAGGKAIVFYRCNFCLFVYFVSIDERPTIRSQPNWTSRSEVVSIYKCRLNFWGPPPNLERKNKEISTKRNWMQTRCRPNGT